MSLSSLQALVVEIEAHLNNRPLIYVTSDLDEPDPLTPSHHCKRIINTLPHPTISQDEITDDDYCTGHTLHLKLSTKAIKHKLWYYKIFGTVGN